MSPIFFILILFSDENYKHNHLQLFAVQNKQLKVYLPLSRILIYVRLLYTYYLRLRGTALF